MAAISGQDQARPGNWHRIEGETGARFWEPEPLQVAYALSGQRTHTVDLIPGNSYAMVWGTDASPVYVVDASVDKWILFTKVGTGVLYCVRESQWPDLELSTTLNLVAFVRWDLHGFGPYQPKVQQFYSANGSATGGGVFGTRNSGSATGGGVSSTSVPMSFSSTFNTNNTNEYIEGSLKIPTTIPARTVLAEATVGSVGVLVISITTDGHIMAEQHYRGGAVSLDLVAGVVAAGEIWHWAVKNRATDNGYYALHGQAMGPAGRTNGPVASGANPTAAVVGNDSGVLGTIAVGKQVASGYADFSTTTGGWWSKVGFAHNTSMEPGGAPTSDPPVASYDAIFLCEQTPGATTTFLDSSGNNYNLAGSGTINTEGPYNT
jgi:hypothetical protein